MAVRSAKRPDSELVAAIHALAEAIPSLRPKGVDPGLFYDSRDFCELMRVSRNRRYAMERELRTHHRSEILENGHGLVADCRLLLDAFPEKR